MVRVIFSAEPSAGKRALSSSGRAIDLHSIGKEFESPRVHEMYVLKEKTPRPGKDGAFPYPALSVAENESDEAASHRIEREWTRSIGKDHRIRFQQG
jgi:hypothetical protein